MTQKKSSPFNFKIESRKEKTNEVQHWKKMEAQWIKALKKNPEKNLDRLNDWLGVENWDEKVDGYEEKNSS